MPVEGITASSASAANVAARTVCDSGFRRTHAMIRWNREVWFARTSTSILLTSWLIPFVWNPWLDPEFFNGLKREESAEWGLVAPRSAEISAMGRGCSRRGSLKCRCTVCGTGNGQRTSLRSTIVVYSLSSDHLTPDSPTIFLALSLALSPSSLLFPSLLLLLIPLLASEQRG
ncbi:hypothetical protein K456DRAFT_48533 [Colletotrichum gloeosporioides 23]|nr:hypothetical protein K456DRAFT_48533 [Colletotrichum gloeosporioides 23]